MVELIPSIQAESCKFEHSRGHTLYFITFTNENKSNLRSADSFTPSKSLFSTTYFNCFLEHFQCNFIVSASSISPCQARLDHCFFSRNYFPLMYDISSADRGSTFHLWSLNQPRGPRTLIQGSRSKIQNRTVDTARATFVLLKHFPDFFSCTKRSNCALLWFCTKNINPRAKIIYPRPKIELIFYIVRIQDQRHSVI